MASIRTRGVVIRRTDKGEADRVLTVITQDRGKIRVMAKGVKKAKAKLAGFLDMFAYNDFMLAEGRNLDIVTSAITVETFMPMNPDYDRIGVMYYACELVDKLIEEDHDVPGVYPLLVQTLKDSARTDINLALVKMSFELKLLSILGIMPEVHHSVVDSSDLDSKEALYFSFRLGGLISNSQRLQDDFAKRVSNSAIKLFRLLGTYPVEAVNKVKMDPQVISEVEQLVAGFVEYNLDIKIKSLRVLGQTDH